MVFDKPLVLRISRTVVQAAMVRPLRSLYDDSGIVSHVLDTLRFKKLTFKKDDNFSKRIKQRLGLELRDLNPEIQVSESLAYLNTPTTANVNARYLSGVVKITTEFEVKAIVFSLDPVGTLTVRQITDASLDFTVG